MEDATLSRIEWDHLYAETDRLILEYLTTGTPVIDASRNFTRTERNHLRTFIAAHGYDAVVVHVTTSEAVARHCWQVNRTNSSRRDVSDTDFEDAVRAMEPPTPDEQPILFHSHNEVEIWLETHIARLR